MFQRFNALRERREGGFTLIELLVVILIIAILAAIAIPVFLNQREKGWVSQSQSALKNAATAMESYATGTGGNYDLATMTDLTGNGYSATANVAVTIVDANTDTNEYCLQADHSLFPAGDADELWFYDSDVGAPQTGACTSN